MNLTQNKTEKVIEQINLNGQEAHLLSAVKELHQLGLELTLVPEFRLQDGKEDHTSEKSSISLSPSTTTVEIASRYMRRNRHYRSVIIFKANTNEDFGSSTVVMPNAGACFEEITSLIVAVRNVVRFDSILIDDLISDHSSVQVDEYLSLFSCKPDSEICVPTKQSNSNKDIPF